MTAAVSLDEPLSVRRFLGDDESLAALARARSEQGFGRIVTRVLQQATDSARSAVGAEVMRSMDGLLDLDLGRMLLAGWRKYRRLIEAAEQTRTAPGTSAVVSLAEHTVTSTHRPRVDLLVREKRVASVHLELAVRFTVRGVAATVREGRLVSLTGGAAEIGAQLSIEDHEVGRRTRRLDLPLVVRLGDGVPLRRAAPEDPSPQDLPPRHGPMEGMPARGAPAQDVPAQDVPAQDVPALDVPAQRGPGEGGPVEGGAGRAPGGVDGSGETGLVVHLPGRDEPLPER
jgi:hypothetical protein